MLSHEFELILHNVGANSVEGRLALAKILKAECGFKQIEVEEVLSGAPALLRRSENRAELEALSDALGKHGARALIVRARSEQVADTPAFSLDDFPKFFSNYALSVAQVLSKVDVKEVQALVSDLLTARKRRAQIFILGNGGSAANASHMANDLSKQRFADESLLFRVMSLADNNSVITATANDMGYESLFTQQLKPLLQGGDLVIGISSSGNSPNVVNALQYAANRGAKTWGISGFDGGELKKACQNSLHIPTKRGQYGYHEDVTLILNHIISIYIYEHDRISKAEEYKR